MRIVDGEMVATEEELLADGWDGIDGIDGIDAVHEMPQLMEGDEVKFEFNADADFYDVPISLQKGDVVSFTIAEDKVNLIDILKPYEGKIVSLSITRESKNDLCWPIVWADEPKITDV
jgi:hypothetical protein